MTPKLTAEEIAALRPLAQALQGAQSADAVFDALLEGFDDARERRKERLAAQREQDAAERKRQQMEYWHNCQRGHERPDQCGPECAKPSDLPILNQRQLYDKFPDLDLRHEARERMKKMRGY